MKYIFKDAFMPKRKHILLAGVAVVLALTATSPAFAGRQVHGGDVARLLSGKNFKIECVDGTLGSGKISQQGMIHVSYRRPTASADESDNALMRVKGVEICLAWKQFGGGGDGCYPVSEEVTGSRFRLSTGPAWCDISTK